MSAPDDHLETRVIHLAEGQDHAAEPLTRPLYKTTTFLFESAAEVEAYNAGRTRKFLYSRYENPTVVGVEEGGRYLEPVTITITVDR